MRTTITALVTGGALMLMSGCGSSSPATTATTTASSAATTPSTAAAPSSSAPVRSGVVQVAYRSIAISPATIRVKVGTTVKWTDYDNVMHNVTSLKGPQKFGSQDFGQGGTYSVKLTRPGTISYECSLHPASMDGTIDVVQ